MHDVGGAGPGGARPGGLEVGVVAGVLLMVRAQASMISTAFAACAGRPETDRTRAWV
ncbi:hypothetical protein ACFWR4_00400 [Streptomyces hydrogenans]|uniref:hypothetical protein n=1 Tax=Streptomyces TaxID=1883 RepID=UPI0027E55753|nr:hypothetical protein [Streptomyces sp. G2]